MKMLSLMNWTDVFTVLGSLAVVAWMLLLIAYVQLWRHRIRRAVQGGAEDPLDRRRERSIDERVREYLANANFSNEGNPNFGWKDLFRPMKLD